MSLIICLCLDYRSPIEYATETFKVSPMWAASTVVRTVFSVYKGFANRLDASLTTGAVAKCLPQRMPW